jgi:hypothetical protein
LWNLALSDRHLNIRALLTQLNLEKKQWRSSELRLEDLDIHHDNVSVHKALSVEQFLAKKKKSNVEMEHPIYCPVLLQMASGRF